MIGKLGDGLIAMLGMVVSIVVVVLRTNVLGPLCLGMGAVGVVLLVRSRAAERAHRRASIEAA